MINFDSLTKEELLYFDIGNTVVKAAFKRDAHWKAIPGESSENASTLLHWIRDHGSSFKGVVVANVRKELTEFIMEEELHLPVTHLSTKDIPTELLDYETPETLGIDRFMACYGATALTENAVVVIDAGTATTIDFMGADDVFRGGMIVPGYYSFSNLLRLHAPVLPETDDSVPESFPGRSTADSMRWGQAGFYKMAIEGILKKYQEQFGDFEVFITGGDAAALAKMLSFESRIRPFLIFEGMERLMTIKNFEF